MASSTLKGIGNTASFVLEDDKAANAVAASPLKGRVRWPRHIGPSRALTAYDSDAAWGSMKLVRTPLYFTSFFPFCSQFILSSFWQRNS
jgi:hypothetical protein